MKKGRWILAAAVALGLVVLVGLAAAGQKKLFQLDAGKIVSIDLYSGSVPAAAYRKTVTRQDDIAAITEKVNRLTYKREVRDEDLGFGGIGLYILFHEQNGETCWLHVYSVDVTMVRTAEEYCVVNGDFKEQALWDTMDYSEELVGEAPLKKYFY